MPSETALELVLLGSMEAITRGPAGERRLGKGKPVALLAYLSLAPGRRASRERLATLLWSEGSSEAARQNLRQTLWYLKRRLGEVVVADEDTIALASGATSDVEEFWRAAQAERYGDATSLYRGEFAPDFAAPGAAAFEDWADLERRRLRATYVGCVESAARTLMSTGHAADAMPLARRAREVAPEDPNSWRLLLECLVASRDTLGAAAAVAQLEHEIATGEFAPDLPIRSLLKAAKRLAGNGSASGDVEPPGAGDAEQSLVPDLIGREAEFRALVDSWEAARRGQGRVILLTGAAGLGKTRLMIDFAARVSSTRGRTLRVRAHPGNRTISGSLAAQLAEGLAALPGAAAISPGSASVLVALSPLLGSSFTGAEADRSTGEDAVRRRASALGELLALLCESSPLAVLVDDAHWADAESMRLIGALRARVEGGKALMVVAGRIPDDLRHHMGNVEEIALRPLDVAGVAEFVGRLASLPTEPWSRGFVPRLHEATHGIPLLIIETLQRLVESGELRRRDAQWEAIAGRTLTEAMPLGSALQVRLQSLSDSERIALVRLATLGRPIAPSSLVPDDAVPTWESSLGELERRSFVARSERHASVWHDEIARGVLDLASAEERLSAHGWASRVLQDQARSLPEFALAAHHALRAGDDGRLSAVWVSALSHARHRGDSRSAVEIAPEVLPSEVRDARLRRLARSAPIRLRITRAHRLVVGAVLLVAAVASLPRVLRARAEQPTLLYFAHPTDSSLALVFEVPSASRWDAEVPLQARSIPRTESPSIGMGAATPLPRSEGWVSYAEFPDSGGQDLVLIGADRKTERLTFTPGDDNSPVPSPDGRRIVYFSRGFDRQGHQAELAVLDLDRRVITRLTNSAADESAPLWSPDGTRLAFRRSYPSSDGDPEVCVSHSDGREQTCTWEGMPTAVTPLVWVDARYLLVQSDLTRDLLRLDTEAESALRLGRPTGRFLGGLSGPFVLCQCYDASALSTELVIAPVESPLALRKLLHENLGTSSMGWASATSGRRSRFLERVSFARRSQRVALDASTAVPVHGKDSEGVPMQPRAVRYHVSDTAILSVANDGTITPRSLGASWVHASAGGWREDSVLVEVTLPTSRTMLVERWTGRLSDQWGVYGDPLPTVEVAPSRPALALNGDGTYSSGVYSLQHWSTSDGLGVELEASIPVSEPKFQNLSFSFSEPMDSTALIAWDHRTGQGPMAPRGLCGTAMPSGEGVSGRRRFIVSSMYPSHDYSNVAPPSDFFTSRWHTIRLQYTTDGRCSLSVDGRKVLESSHPARVPPSAQLLIAGASRGTRVLVRRVEVWVGVRR